MIELRKFDIYRTCTLESAERYCKEAANECKNVTRNWVQCLGSSPKIDFKSFLILANFVSTIRRHPHQSKWRR